MILPQVLENIFYWGGAAIVLLTVIFCVTIITSDKFTDWVAGWMGKNTFMILFAIALVAGAICLSLGMISRSYRLEAQRNNIKEELQEQCIEYHNNHPDNWIVCPVCEENLD